MILILQKKLQTMFDIDELNEKFSIEGELGFMELENELIAATITNKYAEADIFLYGAHIASFKPYRTMGILWLSPQSDFEVGKPIRGGIPVCFPWFGVNKHDSTKPMHGFGRLMYWNVVETGTTSQGETSIRLQFESSEQTKVFWPYDFKAEFIVIVGKKLSATLKVTNTSSETFEYGCALHSYYSVSAIENITIEGLGGTSYYDQLQGGKEERQETPELKLEKAETRHYHNTEVPVLINDPYFGRTIKVDKSGSKVTTVWNPGAEACAGMADLPDESYHSFLCVETVNSFDDMIRLNPGQSFETSTIIGLNEEEE